MKPDIHPDYRPVVFTDTSAGVTLTGSFTAGRDGKISAVATQMMRCHSAGCNPYRVTETFLKDANGNRTELNIAKGQIVQVRVVVSFS